MENSIYIDIINRKSIRAAQCVLSLAQLSEQLSLHSTPEKQSEILSRMGEQSKKLTKEFNDFQENLQLFVSKISMDNEEIDE